MNRYILGLDIGGTKTAVILGDFDGQILDRVDFATRPERGFQQTFDQLIEVLGQVRAKADQAGHAPTVVSVSIGGPLEIEPGIIHSPPNLPGWDDIPLKDLLAERTGLPVYVEHDGNAGALAEWYFGAARGARNVIFLTMGTGFGGGLILNGDLYRGTTDLAGEVGHLRIAPGGPIAFGKAGSWEGLCGGNGIARQAMERFPTRWSATGVTARDLADLARAGDQDALAVWKEVGRNLGLGLAILIDVLNPEVIVIGSLAVRLGELVLGPAREELKREALPGAVAACRIVPAALGERLGDVAALCAAIRAGTGSPRRRKPKGTQPDSA
ncbi:MAG TPA: ROK family protein [Phycisphaerae bacterium]|nr:ROK family protein [Phycisphaerae bacterium]